MLSLSGLSAFFTWGSICLCHVRFRRAMHLQGRSLDELPFKAAAGLYDSIYGVVIIFLVLVAQFWTALFPNGKASAYDFSKFGSVLF